MPLSLAKGAGLVGLISGYRTYGTSWADLEQTQVPSPSTSSNNSGFKTRKPKLPDLHHHHHRIFDQRLERT
jgi:hypothetical protein